MGNNLGLDGRGTLNINIDKQNLNNININNTCMSRDFSKAKLAESLAHRLVEVFKQPDYFKFYCKVAHTLPENKIWNNVEQAQSAKATPARLFTWLCQKDMSA